MSPSKPRVSIGLPVYNGEKYLAAALESLLAQDFQDFEIIICDNASTDGTESICREYALRDERIRYHRNPRNLGAAPNFNLAFRLASGEYFKWAAHDDLHAPEFLSRCVAVLDENPSVVLCHTEVQFIGERGEAVRNRGVLPANIASPVPLLRFTDLAGLDHWCLDIFGLMRTSALARTPLIAHYVGSDRNTLVRLALMGPFHRIPEVLFFSRHHRERSVCKLKLNDRAEWFDTRRRGSLSFPSWRLWIEYIKSVACAQISPRERVLCHLHLLKWLHTYRKQLKADLKVAMKHLAGQMDGLLKLALGKRALN